MNPEKFNTAIGTLASVEMRAGKVLTATAGIH